MNQHDEKFSYTHTFNIHESILLTKSMETRLNLIANNSHELLRDYSERVKHHVKRYLAYKNDSGSRFFGLISVEDNNLNNLKESLHKIKEIENELVQYDEERINLIRLLKKTYIGSTPYKPNQFFPNAEGLVLARDSCASHIHVSNNDFTIERLLFILNDNYISKR